MLQWLTPGKQRRQILKTLKGDPKGRCPPRKSCCLCHLSCLLLLCAFGFFTCIHLPSVHLCLRILACEIGAVKQILKPILKMMGPVLDPIKLMVQKKLKAILSKATKKLPTFKMPKYRTPFIKSCRDSFLSLDCSRMKLPKLPTKPKGWVSPNRYHRLLDCRHAECAWQVATSVLD